MARAYVCGTFDTKGPELLFIAERLRAAGVEPRTVDLSTRPHAVPVDVSAAQVAQASPDDASDATAGVDRGRGIAAMTRAFERFIGGCDDVAGAIAAGGSGNTALVAPGFRSLPIGIPKLIVSTVASGNVAPYVRESDIAMYPAVADIQGLNAITLPVLANAAHALAGAIRFREDQAATAQKSAVGLTMFGVTTPCVQRVAELLAPAYDPIIFHAVGTGGRAMEALVSSGLIKGVIDATTTEICDMMMGGIFPADEQRFDSIIRTRVPYVVSVGALDMVNFGVPETVPERYRGRIFYEHNPQVTLMRTTAAENTAMAEWMAAKLNRMAGPVRVLLPEAGVSALDVPGQKFHDPDADRCLFDTLEAKVVQTDRRRLQRLKLSINEPAFADALVDAFLSIAA